jgi:hypothetical protein
MLFRNARIKCSSIWAIDGNGQAKIIVCSKAHPWVKALFAQCGGLVPPPLNNMEVPVHIPNGRTKDVAMET